MLLDGIFQTLRVDRLEQVIDRILLVGTQRKVLVGRRKHDQGHVVFAHILEHFEGIHVRHLDIEENNIRVKLADSFQSLGTRARLTHDLELRSVGFQQRLDAHAGQRFIIYDKDFARHYFPSAESVAG